MEVMETWLNSECLGIICSVYCTLDNYSYRRRKLNLSHCKGCPTLIYSNWIRACLKEALSLMLCLPVFIFPSGNSALLGCPCCGLSIWLLLLNAISNTLFWVYVNFFMRKLRKQEILKVVHFRMIWKWPLMVIRCAKH